MTDTQDCKFWLSGGCRLTDQLCDSCDSNLSQELKICALEASEWARKNPEKIIDWFEQNKLWCSR